MFNKIWVFSALFVDHCLDAKESFSQRNVVGMFDFNFHNSVEDALRCSAISDLQI